MHRYQVRDGERVNLRERDASDRSLFEGDKKDAKNYLETQNARLSDLQELLWAQRVHRVLVVLQAMDTGGKDGTIRHVFEGVNPQGVRVAYFEKPTSRELHRDFLWRVHTHVPGNGEIVIFNRSHYEDVLVVRVRGLITKARCEQRYRHIRAFEELLADEGTLILKFFLHISKDEQLERLQSRLDTPDKRWKFQPGDLDDRARWDDFVAAYEDALSATSSKKAPRFIIPANRKWYRNVVVSEILIEALESLDMSYPEPAEGLESVVLK